MATTGYCRSLVRVNSRQTATAVIKCLVVRPRFADLKDTVGGVLDDSGIFLGDGVGTVVQIAREGQDAPDGNGVVSGFGSNIELNDSGQASFLSRVTETNGLMQSAIFVGDVSTGVVQIARTGRAAPQSDGIFWALSPPQLNEMGQVAFYGEIAVATGEYIESEGIFLSDANGNVLKLATTGVAAPDDNGLLASFGNPVLNDAGQVAFTASLFDTAGGIRDSFGLFMYDQTLGIIQVARVGDALLGSSITELSFNSFNDFYFVDPSAGRSGLNQFGQVAYSFRLADGREGVAVWAIPEPRFLVMVPVIFLVVASRRRCE